MTLYEREFDSARACEQHARFIPMPDAEEEEWTRAVRDELGHDADLCEFCAEEVRQEALRPGSPVAQAEALLGALDDPDWPRL